MVLGTFVIPGSYATKPTTPSYPISGAGPGSIADAEAGLGSATIAGRVYGPDGTTVAGAEVSLSGSGFWPPRAVQSESDGRFVWRGIPAGIYELRASHRTLASTPVEGLILDPGSRRVFGLQLAEGWTLSGKVVDAQSGRPLVGADVDVATGRLGAYSRRTQTNDEGSFKIRGVVGDHQNVYIEADGYVPFGPRVAFADAPEIDARLERGATLQGTVVDSDGKPIKDAVVRAYGGDASFVAPVTLDSLGVTAGPVPPITTVVTRQLGFAEQVVTGGDGAFLFSKLRSGDYTVAAAHDSYAPGESRSIELGAGRTVSDVRVALYPGAELRGRVFDALGRGLGGIPVELRTDGDRLPRMTVSSEDGSFVFAGVRGEVTVTALPYDLQPASERVSMAGDERIEIELILSSALLTLQGRVVDERGVGVEGALVTATSTTAGATVRRSGKSDFDGTFSVPALPDPPYDVQVEHPAFSTVRLNQIEETDDLTVEVAEGVTLQGRVLDDWSGKPVAGAVIDLNGPATLSARAARDGWFVFRQAPVGTYDVRFSHPDFEDQAQRIEVVRPLYADRPEELTVVRLAPGGTIEGEVLGAYGQPVANAEVAWGYPPAWERGVSTDALGKFRLRGVPPGSVWLTARHPELGEGETSEPVNVRPKETSPEAYVRLPGRVELVP